MKIFLPVSLLLPTASIFGELLIAKDSHVHACVCVCVCVHAHMHAHTTEVEESFYFIQSE